MIQAQNKAGKVHVDRVSYESSDWSVADILSQFSCVLYLQLPKTGGELEFYQRLWKPKDVDFEFSKDPKVRTGVNEKLVEQCERFKFFPKTGDLLIFNTTYYHRVLESSSEEFRITSLSFLGVNRQNEIVFFM
ncbi:MAG: hypothetical protein HC919_04565 [Oscillatoriales cyanobacterium SM2_2_1]|nr:hypothetical protein [Oscillatoriales cyanobacterium SM2_2_1]